MNEHALYQMIFSVTETLQNGKEKTHKKSVMSPRFRDGKHITESERVQKGIELLKSKHYYNIKYLETKCIEILWIC